MSTVVSGEFDLQQKLTNASGKLVVVYFTANWCGPCKAISPSYENLAYSNPDVVFLKVIEGESDDCIHARGISAFPTFHLYLKSEKQEEIRGANLPALQTAIQKWSEKAEKPFSGQGLSLGGSTPSMSPDDVRNRRLQALASKSTSGAASKPVSDDTAQGQSDEQEEEATPFEFNAEALDMLKSMGFSENASKRALASCRHLTSADEQIASAIEWLDTNADAPDLNDPFDMESLKGSDKKLSAEETQRRILELREQRARKEKEDERQRELRRREQGQLAKKTAEEIRDIQRKAQEDKRRRERELVAREALRQRLELAKDKAERESRMHGQVSEATAELIRELQDQWDGKDVTVSASKDPKERVEGLVSGLAMQKSDNAGSIAARFIDAVFKNVVKDPNEEKYRRIPWEAGKKVRDAVTAVVGGAQLMKIVGWAEQEDNGNKVLVLPSTADLELTKYTLEMIEKFRNEGKF